MRRERSAAFACLPLAAALLLSACATGGRTSSPRETIEDQTPTQRAADVNVQLGQAYMAKGQLELALDKLTRALELDPDSAEAHTVIAVLFERINRPARAESHYQRAVELSPNNGDVLNNYGTFLCRAGRFEEADSHFLKAIDDPFYRTPLAALANAGVCAAQGGMTERAESYFRQVLQREPRDSLALYQLADLQFQRGELMSARGFIQRLESAAPPSAEALELALRIEEGLGDDSAAARYRERLGKEFPDHEPESGKSSGETNTP